MKILIVLCAFVALAVASDTYDDKKPAAKKPVGKHGYHGRYSGHCANDGLYFRDANSFVFCSNGNSYVQHCAPGTRNSGHEKFSYGGEYTYRDFCDVNLVDHGYGVRHGAGAYRNNYYDRPYYGGYYYDRPYGYYGYGGRYGHYY